MSAMAKNNGNGAVRSMMQQHADGPAAMLAIGTANPTGMVLPQDEFVDDIFRLTNSDHLTELKQKLKRICKHMNPPSIPVFWLLLFGYASF
jgi:hypothetical protein